MNLISSKLIIHMLFLKFIKYIIEIKIIKNLIGINFINKNLIDVFILLVKLIKYMKIIIIPPTIIKKVKNEYKWLLVNNLI